MRVLVTGAGGQLGQELCKTAPANIELHAYERERLDLSQPRTVDEAVRKVRPEWIVNAAACTAVDRVEREPDLAFAVNQQGAAYLASAALNAGSRLLQVSTDFVFNGQHSRPYRPGDIPAPVCVYGESKLAGEHAVRETLGQRALVLRTSWLYSAGGTNFVTTVLRLLGERERLSVVSDQVGTPTWARGLAVAIWRMVVEGDITGVHHWTDAGVASWYDFAVAIQEEALERGLLKTPKPVLPISTTAYPTPARRPAYSVLDKTGTWDELGDVAPHWRVSLGKMLDELASHAVGIEAGRNIARRAGGGSYAS